MKGFLKKYFLLAAMAAYIFLAIASLAGGEAGINERKLSERETEPPAATEGTPTPIYRIGLKGGSITVFDARDGTVVRRTDTRASLLPEKDRKKLERGITVEGKSRLRKALEDICS